MDPTTNRFWGAFVCAILLSVHAGCSGESEPDSRTETAAPEPARPNVVLVVSDALRQDALGCYGGRTPTPNLDGLAARGVRFENAYTTSPWTPPSTVSIFTGNYATSYPYAPYEKTVKAYVPDGEVLLPEALAEMGYRTGMVIENVQSSLHNCLQGLVPLSERGPVAGTAKKAIWEALGAQTSRGKNLVLLNFLMTVPADRNFFAVQWMLDPHEPFRHNRFTDEISVDESKLTLPKRQYTSHTVVSGEMTNEEIKYLKARYLAEVRSVDERVGHILKILEHKRLLDNTYVVFTSDHGELFGEHALFGHGINYFETLMRVPLIIAGPNLPEGKTVSAAVSLVDLMPTLKDLLGVDYEDSMQGESFRSVIVGESTAARPVYFDDIREHENVDAVLQDDFKLIARRDGTWQLYNLTKDPGEAWDIAADHPDRVRSMAAALEEIRSANAARRADNMAKLEGNEDPLNDEEKAELEKKLKSLGYVH